MFQTFKGSSKFKSEIDSWVDEGIISSQQANVLRERYELDAAPPWYKRTDFILKGVAAFFLVLAYFQLISSNWDDLPIPIRMLSGLLPLFAVYAFLLKFILNNNKDGVELLAFLACMLLGGNIWLQAQIFHINSYFPDGLLWWVLGSLPFAIFLRSTILNLGVQALFITWLSWQNNYDQFSFWGIIILGAIVYIQFSKPNRIGVIVFGATLFAFISNIINATEGFGTGFWEFNRTYTFYAAFILLYFSILKIEAHKYSEIFIDRLQRLVATSIIGLFFLYVVEDDFIRYIVGDGVYITSFIVFFIAVGIIATQLKTIGFEVISVFAITSIFFILNVVTNFLEFDNYSRLGKDTAFIIFVIMNILFFAYCIAKVYFGIKFKVKRHFFWGVIYLLIIALTRYINYFHNYIITSLTFVGAALFIFFINKYWNEKLER